MDAPSVVSRPMPWEPWWLPRAGVLASGAALSLLAGAGALLGVRRLAGALVDPLPPLAMAVTILLAACAAHVVHRTANHTQPRLARWGLPAAATLGMLLLAAAISLPGASTGGLIAVWGLLVVEEVHGWWPRKQAAALPRRSEPPAIPKPQAPPPERRVPQEPSPELLPVDEQVERQLLDRRSTDGRRQVDGWLRAWFAPRQRTTSEHISFCPPFANTPSLDFEQSDGPTVRIKLAQLLPYGARFDIKLVEAADETVPVVITFTATESRRD